MQFRLLYCTQPGNGIQLPIRFNRMICLVRRSILCYNVAMKTKQALGWVFVLTGTMFLFSGMMVMIFATFRPGWNDPLGGEIDPSVWVSLANRVMQFIIELLEVEWTRVRVGVFLIVIGFLMDGGGAYFMITSEQKPKRKSTSKRSSRKTRRK